MEAGAGIEPAKICFADKPLTIRATGRIEIQNFLYKRTYLPLPAQTQFVKQKKISMTCIKPSAFHVFPHGFEPRLSEPKSDVLPLHHRKILCGNKRT